MKDLIREPLTEMLVNHFGATEMPEGGHEFFQGDTSVAVYVFDLRDDDGFDLTTGPVTVEALESGDVELHLMVERDGYVATEIRPVSLRDEATDLMMWIIERIEGLEELVMDDDYRRDWDEQIASAKLDPFLPVLHFQNQMDMERFQFGKLLNMYKFNFN